MKKITDLPKVSELYNNNVLLTDGVNGTKGILAKDLLTALFNLLTPDDIAELIDMDELLTPISSFGNANILIGTESGNKRMDGYWAMFNLIDAIATVPLRRQCYRGKNLGNAVTSQQHSEIANGTFRGLMLGDFWIINDIYWRIVDFDYWIGTGDTECTTHHLVIMPDKILYEAQMNSSATTSGGYAGSYMRDNSGDDATATGIYDAIATIYNTFAPMYILQHREILTNAVTNGYPSGGAWYDSTIELPNEIMMYGSHIFTPAGNGTITSYLYTIDKTQLAAMAANPDLIKTSKIVGGITYQGTYQWLRDVVSGTNFACILPGGVADSDDARCNYGVRPVFGLTG